MSTQGMEKRLGAMGLSRPIPKDRRVIAHQERAMARSLRRLCGGAFGNLKGKDLWTAYAYGTKGDRA